MNPVDSKFRPDGTGKAELVHSLNGTGFAVGRTLIAIDSRELPAEGRIGRYPGSATPVHRRQGPNSEMKRAARAIMFVTVCFCASVSAQNAEIEWAASLNWSAADKREIIALAKLLGVGDPASVDVNLRDDCCRIASVTSRVVENGPERRWSRALMVRDSWREYFDERRHENALRVGHWIADGPTTVFADWRVRDGAWFVDVADGNDGAPPGPPYRDAELIVLSLHRGTVVNKIAETTLKGRRFQPSIPGLKAGARYMLNDEPVLGGQRPMHQYEFWIDNKVLGIRITGDVVEVVALFEVQF
jgi:hypothetical protein